MTKKRRVRREICHEYNKEVELFDVCRISGFDRNWSIKKYQVHPSMDAGELLMLRKNKRYTSDVIRGIFSSNNLSYLVSKYPAAYICNTDPSYLPGSHWVVFLIYSPIQSEFYDSSRIPSAYFDSAFKVFFQNKSKQCLFSK